LEHSNERPTWFSCMSTPAPTGGSSRRAASPKKRGSPGPGAYDPKPTSSLGQSHRKGQTSSFKSSSVRGIEKELVHKGEGGDPGRYNPSVSYTDPRKKSFGWEQAPTPSTLEKLKNGKGKKGKQGTFGGGTAKRELTMDLLGEGGPGPGSYLPASTFGSYSKSSNSNPKKASSPFRSGAAQRPRPMNEHVPGAGAYTPNHNSVEKNRSNSAPHLAAKGYRFSRGGVDANLAATDDDIGPGAYESHVHGSVAKNVAKNVDQMSRQNPGFGIAGPAHELPHEQAVEDDTDLPGPGHFEIKATEIASVNGHTSAFKQPTKRTKGPPDADIFNMGSGSRGAANAKGGSKKGGKKGLASADATVHV